MQLLLSLVVCLVFCSTQLITGVLAENPPTAGGAGRALFFSSRGSHTSDIMSWLWENPPQQDFTVEYWIRFGNPHRYHATLSYAVYDIKSSGTYNTGYEIYIYHGWGMGLGRSVGFNGECWQDRCMLEYTSQYEWNHVAFSFNSATGEMNYYKNGERLLGEAATQTGFDYDTPIVPGGMGLLGQDSDKYNEDYRKDDRGDYMIDEFRVWNTIRTQNEIEKYMHRVVPAGTPGLNLMYTFDDTDGDDTVVQDASGNGNSALVGRVAVGHQGLSFIESSEILPPTAPRYVVSRAPFGGGQALRYGLRADDATNTITLIGTDMDGDVMKFSITSIPSASVGTLYQFGTSTPINPGDAVEDFKHRVDMRLTSGSGGRRKSVTGMQALQALVSEGGGSCSSSDCKIGYSVSDRIDGESTAEVLLEPWVELVPENLMFSIQEDGTQLIPLSELDQYGERLWAVITELPAKGTLYYADFRHPYLHLSVKPVSKLTPITASAVGQAVTTGDFQWSSVVYAPPANENEGDAIDDPDAFFTSFKYALETDDGIYRSDPATVKIRVRGDNDAPEVRGMEELIPEAMAYRAQEDTPVVAPSGAADSILVNFTSTDVDAVAAQTFYRITKAPSVGQLFQVVADGSVGDAVEMELQGPFDLHAISAPLWSSQYTECEAECEFPDGPGCSKCKLTSWHASQVIGPPDHFPNEGDSELTWATFKPCCSSWIVLEFEIEIFVKEVELFETALHGAATEISTAKEFTGNVSTTEWITRFLRPEAVPMATPGSFIPPLCPPFTPSKFLLLRFDTSESENVYHNLDAVRISGTLDLDGGKLVTPQVAYRPVPGIHGPKDAPMTSFEYKADDCETVSHAAAPVSITINPPEDVRQAVAWKTLEWSIQVQAEAVNVDVDIGALLVVEAEKAFGNADVTLGSLGVTLKYLEGEASNTLFLTSLEADAQTPLSSSSSNEPLEMAPSRQLVVRPGVEDRERLEFGVWLSSASSDPSRTYRIHVAITYDCPAGYDRVDGAGCVIPTVHCTPDHWQHVVGGCDASSQRPVTFSWRNAEERGCNSGHLPVDTTVACEYVAVSSSTGSVVVAIAVVGVLVAAFFSSWLTHYKAKPVVRYAQYTICILYCLGAALQCLGLLSQLGENTDFNCMFRAWAFHIPLTLMFGSLYVKVRRVITILDNKKMVKRKVPARQSYIELAKMMLVDVALLTLWTFQSPSKPVTEVKVEPGVGEVQETVCKTDGGGMVTAMILYKGMVIVYGVYLSYRSRKLDPRFSESTHMVLAIYNIAFVGGIVVLITQTMEMAPDSVMMLQALGIGWCTVASLALLFVPKMLMLSDDGSLTSVRGSTGTGGEDSSSGDSMATMMHEHRALMLAYIDDQAKWIVELEQKVVKGGEPQSVERPYKEVYFGPKRKKTTKKLQPQKGGDSSTSSGHVTKFSKVTPH